MALYVFVAALVTAIATGLGAAPFLLGRESLAPLLGAANAVAAGVMLGASAGLAIEGIDRSAARTAAGAFVGAAFVAAAARAVGAQEAVARIASLRGSDARKALLVVAVMTAHSAAEGIGMGAAFGDTLAVGIVIAAAIAVQNVPEGLAISLVLVPRGARVRSAAWWSVFSSLPQPVLAVPAFLFVEEFQLVLPAGLGFAAGAMAWMVIRELLPDAITQARPRTVLAIVAASFAAMLGVQLALAG